MFGYQEILIISAIVFGALVLPRIIKPPKQAPPRLVKPKKSLTGAVRLAVAASLLYPLVAAAVMRPWQGELIAYLYTGLGPVLMGWLLFWVLRGFRRR